MGVVTRSRSCHQKWGGYSHTCICLASELTLCHAVLLKSFLRSLSKTPGNTSEGKNQKFLLYVGNLFGYSGFYCLKI